MQITGNSSILENNPTLRQRLSVREPFITPLNVQQAVTLRKMRSGMEAIASLKPSRSADVVSLNVTTEYAPGLEDTLIIAMKGIAAGMQNTG